MLLLTPLTYTRPLYYGLFSNVAQKQMEWVKKALEERGEVIFATYILEKVHGLVCDPTHYINFFVLVENMVVTRISEDNGAFYFRPSYFP